MDKCRYFPECQRCNEVGDSWIPCSGGSDGIQCDAYEPMPDVEGLLALADDMDSCSRFFDGSEFADCLKQATDFGFEDYANIIRKALGEE